MGLPPGRHTKFPVNPLHHVDVLVIAPCCQNNFTVVLDRCDTVDAKIMNSRFLLQRKLAFSYCENSDGATCVANVKHVTIVNHTENTLTALKSAQLLKLKIAYDKVAGARSQNSV